MRFRLLDNWRSVVKHAWSIRLILIAGLLSAIEVALPFTGDILPLPPGVFAALSAVATGAAFVARIIAQKDVSE